MSAATRPPRRGVYLLPATFTTGNLLCGFFCIVEAARGGFDRAAVLIVLAGILDSLDGRIARMTGTTSEFGVQLDSLADIVSFGLAPSLLAYFWALTPFRRLGWLMAFLFVVCAAMRLARFNLQSGTMDKRFFAGLPSPAAAGSVAAIVFAAGRPPVELWQAGLFGAATVALALLMVSRLRYRSFKDLDLKSRRSSVWVLMIAALIIGILSEPRWALVAFATVYVVSAPATYLWSLATRGGSGGAGAGKAGASRGPANV